MQVKRELATEPPVSTIVCDGGIVCYEYLDHDANVCERWVCDTYPCKITDKCYTVQTEGPPCPYFKCSRLPLPNKGFPWGELSAVISAISLIVTIGYCVWKKYQARRQQAALFEHSRLENGGPEDDNGDAEETRGNPIWRRPMSDTGSLREIDLFEEEPRVPSPRVPSNADDDA